MCGGVACGRCDVAQVAALLASQHARLQDEAGDDDGDDRLTKRGDSEKDWASRLFTPTYSGEPSDPTRGPWPSSSSSSTSSSSSSHPSSSSSAAESRRVGAFPAPLAREFVLRSMTPLAEQPCMEVRTAAAAAAAAADVAACVVVEARCVRGMAYGGGFEWGSSPDARCGLLAFAVFGCSPVTLRHHLCHQPRATPHRLYAYLSHDEFRVALMRSVAEL